MGMAHIAQFSLAPLAALLRRPEIGFEQFLHAVGPEDPARHFADHDVVELVHGNAQTLAGKVTLLQPVAAGIVAIAPALAGVLDHRGSACTAPGNACEKRGRVHQSWSHPLWGAALQVCLHGVELLLVDDGWNIDPDPLGWRAGALRAAIGPVEVVSAMIGAAGEDLVDAAGGEPVATPEDRALVQMRGDSLDAHGLAGAARGQIEDLANDAGLGLVDDQSLLVLVPAPLDDLGAVAIRRRRSVPEALPGILQHGPMNVLGVLPALVFVEYVDHLAEELTAGILRHFLRDGDQFDACLAQLTDVELGMQGIATEAAQRMDDDGVEGMVCALRRIDHLLEDRTVLVESGSSRLGVELHDLDAMLLAPCTALGRLVWK